VLRGKSGVKRPLDRELALGKPVKHSKKFSLPSSSIPTSNPSTAGASSS
jgi:hypothetical protein